MVEPKSQLEKRVDAVGNGKEYLAGLGLYLNGNQFNLKYASGAEVGGVCVSVSTETGIYLVQGVATLRKATKSWHGGFKLGDGLVPVLTDEYGHSGFVKVRVGEGLYYIDNEEVTEEGNPYLYAENRLGGRRVCLAVATDKSLGGVKVGKGLKIDDDGVLTLDTETEEYANFSAGEGISFSETENGNSINVKYDNETVMLNEKNELTAKAKVENVIVIAEEDVSQLLHTYTQVGYYSGNRIVCGGPANNIVVGGYLFSHSSLTEAAPNLYHTASFSEAGKSASTMTSGYSVSMEIERTDLNSSYIVWRDNVSTSNLRGATTFDVNGSGVFFSWNNIYAPTEEHPNGYVVGTMQFAYIDANGNLVKTGSQAFYAGFSSTSEYNAAIGLTYEAQNLIEVQETVTEV